MLRSNVQSSNTYAAPTSSQNKIPSPSASSAATVEAASKKVTPERKNINNNPNKPILKNNNKFTKNHPSNHHLSVEKQIIDELLLVCGVIGSTSVDPNDDQKIIPVEDCLNWLQDLQRALRRDEDAYRPISLLLGQWKVVQQKLLPLVLSCRYDTPLVLTIVKILVILTKPLSESAINAGKLVIDTKNKNVDDAVIEEQIKLRDNAIAQANLLTEYKKLFVYHPSHRNNTNNTNKAFKKNSQQNNKKHDSQQGGLLSIFVSLLTEPLSRTGMMRREEDHLTVELILHLFRNLLCAGEPLLKDAENIRESAKLHQELISLFDRELVLDILLVIGQEMESRENAQYNLLIMEILHHLLKSQDPTLVARSVISKSTTATTTTATANNSNAHSKSVAMKNRFQSSHSSSKTGSLLEKLQKEKQILHAASSSRHSHFGGTLELKKDEINKQFVTATTSKNGIQSRRSNLAQVDAKRKTKKHQYFIGSGKPVSAYYARPEAVHSSATFAGPTSLRAQRALHSFCTKFLTQCYGPVMKSLKDEFRKESNRLEDEDKVIFFRIVWFFCQWRRVFVEEGEALSPTKDSVKENDEVDTKSIGKLVFTMDVFTFNMVLSSLDFYLEHKKHKHLAQTVSLYTEMIRLLNTMYVSSDSMENIMAMGLMDHLFYKQDPMDKLPKLLSRWTPGTFSIDYLCDLIDLTYTTLKILETNEKACSELGVKDKKDKKGKREEAETLDRVIRMKEKAAEFDTTVYIARKIISNQTMFMFTQLLSQYNFNAPRINDHIISFFIRLCKFVVAKDDDFDYMDTQNNEANLVTLEPMLFNIPLLTVMNEILSNQNLRNDKDFRSVISFGSTLVRHYARTCEKNPMLFVETLFRHSLPHRYCEIVSNNYVSEELKMIAEREMLLEQQAAGNDGDDEDIASHASSDDEEEMEFEGDERETRRMPVRETKKIKDTRKNKVNVDSRGNDEESSDDDEEVEFDDNDDNANDVTSKASTKSNEEKVEEENLQYDDGNEATSNPPTEAIEDDRWNDRRVFIPKHKRQSVDDEEIDQIKESKDDTPKENAKRILSKRKLELSDNEDDESLRDNDDEKDQAVSETEQVSDLKPKKRIRRSIIDESSDEEEFGDTQVTLPPSQSGNKTMFEDSDDDDDE